MLKDYLKSKGISIYELSKGSNVPYTTVREFVSKNNAIDKVTYGTFKRIQEYLKLSENELISIIKSECKAISFASTWEDARNWICNFPIIVANNNYDASRIYPLMQKDVDNVYNLLKKYQGIKKVILFGSSVTIRCNHESDLDFAIELEKSYDDDEKRNNISEEIQKVTSYNSDILWINNLDTDSTIYENIMKGVVIYE